MTDAADGDSIPAHAVRWLRSVPATLVFCALLSLVYAVELLVWELWGFEAFAALFVAEPAPSVAWLLAPLAHSPVDPWHLPVNVVLLLAYGGMTERRLRRRPYLWFLAVAGVASTAGQVFGSAVATPAGEASGTLGASGIGLAATGFAVTASLRARAETGEWPGETTWLWVAVGAVIIARRVVLDLAIGVPNVGRYGHLWGVLFGAAYGLFVWRRDPAGN